MEDNSAQVNKLFYAVNSLDKITEGGKNAKSPYITSDELTKTESAILIEGIQTLSDNVKKIIEILLKEKSPQETAPAATPAVSNITIPSSATTTGNTSSALNQVSTASLNTQIRELFTQRLDDNSNQESTDSLTPDEQERYKEIFTILGNTLEIGKFAKGPEAKRLTSPSIPAALPSNTGVRVESTKSIRDLNQEDYIKSLLLKTGIAGLLYQILTENFSGLLQTLYRTLKVAANTAFEQLKIILKPISELIEKGIDNALKGIKTVTQSIGNFIRSSTLVKDVTSLFDDLTTTIGTFFTNIKDELAKKVSLITEKFKNLLPGFMRPNTPAVPPTTVPTPAGTTTALPRTVTPTIPTTPLPTLPPAATRTVAPAATGFKATVNRALNTITAPVRTAIRSLYKSAGGAKGILKGIGKTLNPLTTKLPIVGPLIELFFGKGDIEKLKAQRKEGKITTDDELYNLAGQRVIRGLGGLFGGALGATVVGLLTGPTGPFAIVGALAGGVMGDITGRIVADFMSKNLIPESATKEVGQVVVAGLQEEELQDFIIKNGQLYKFSNKDEVLGMKEGGAISNLVSSIVTNNTKYYSIASRQVKVLEEIRDGIKLLINKEPNNTNAITQNSNKSTQPSFSTFRLRSDFDTMNNIAAI